MAQPNGRIELAYAMRRLNKIAELSGGGPKKKKDEGPPVDTSKMSEFEKGQYFMAVSMKRIRDNIEKLDAMDANGSTATKAELGNQIRKDIAQMKKDAINIKKSAQAEGKRSEYETLLTHKSKTEQLFSSRFVQDEGTRAALNAAAAGGNKKGAPGLSSLLDAPAAGGQEMQPMMSVRDDEEFQLFFQQTKNLDKKMDQALDRISMGVSRLHENANQIGSELKVQAVLLSEQEKKVDKLNEQMYTLNHKLKKTLDDVDKDKWCVYLICCILLLGILGYLATQSGLIKM
jgi:SYP7 family syntaxin